MRRVPDLHAELNAFERRRRWKLVAQIGGILLIVVGMALLPLPKHPGFTKDDLSFYTPVRNSGMFVRWGSGFILVGLIALAGSFLIRADTSE